ncbi:AmmeMemoRadiSam system protein B [Candidatus Saccharibacteria bacterium]|nr:AmmeMemoRadiSam system protein B [Candidatus Saccharibacteria bacterium]
MHKILLPVLGSVVVVAALISWQFILQTETVPITPPRFTVVVPHHDLVKINRQEFWQDFLLKYPLAKTVQKIILVGPDHFGTRQDIISYTDENFTLYDHELINGLSNHRPPFANVVKNTTLIKSDHAITALLTELSAHFPAATLSPFLIGEKIKFDSLNKLLDFILSECDTACLVVASVDFSHNLSLSQANAKDAETLTQLSAMSITDGSLTVPDHADCPACLYTIQELGRSWDYTWYLWGETNSTGNDINAINTVSHIYGGYLPEATN